MLSVEVVVLVPCVVVPVAVDVPVGDISLCEDVVFLCEEVVPCGDDVDGPVVGEDKDEVSSRDDVVVPVIRDDEEDDADVAEDVVFVKLVPVLLG